MEEDTSEIRRSQRKRSIIVRFEDIQGEGKNEKDRKPHRKKTKDEKEQEEKILDEYWAKSRHGYKCKKCDKILNRKYALIHHVQRIHLRVKQVQCSHAGCGMLFFDRKDFTDHFNSVHGGESRKRMKKLKSKPFNYENPYFKKDEDAESPLFRKEFQRCDICFLNVPNLEEHEALVKATLFIEKKVVKSYFVYIFSDP